MKTEDDSAMNGTNWKPPPARDPCDGLPPERVAMAMRIALPLLATLPAEPADAVAREERTRLEGAARTMVRRIVGALNGLDVESHAASEVSLADRCMLIDRALLGRLRAALLNADVAATVEKTVGEAETAALLGELGGIG